MAFVSSFGPSAVVAVAIGDEKGFFTKHGYLDAAWKSKLAIQWSRCGESGNFALDGCAGTGPNCSLLMRSSRSKLFDTLYLLR